MPSSLSKVRKPHQAAGTLKKSKKPSPLRVVSQDPLLFEHLRCPELKGEPCSQMLAHVFPMFFVELLGGIVRGDLVLF